MNIDDEIEKAYKKRSEAETKEFNLELCVWKYHNMKKVIDEKGEYDCPSCTGHNYFCKQYKSIKEHYEF